MKKYLIYPDMKSADGRSVEELSLRRFVQNENYVTVRWWGTLEHLDGRAAIVIPEEENELPATEIGPGLRPSEKVNLIGESVMEFGGWFPESES